jgi:hypothetical protein
MNHCLHSRRPNRLPENKLENLYQAEETKARIGLWLQEEELDQE